MSRIPASQTKQIRINNFFSELKEEDIPNDILNGLKSKPKYISAKYFYDAKGSRLFEQITKLDEYYQTRSEKKILANIVAKINFGFKDSDIIELGSGDHSKITLLLNQLSDKELQSIRYMPADISRSALEKSSANLHELFPKLTIEAFVMDFMSQLNVLPNERKRLFCFFGGTVGNLSKSVALNFINNISRNMHRGDMFLLGFDRIKDVAVIEKAYNDSKGITADFNKNILDNINKLANLNLNRNDFEHLAFYNSTENRIEMHLKAEKDLKINGNSSEDEILLSKGETIHTENSHKFDNQMIKAMASASGLKIRAILSDEKNYFGMACMVKR
jgi:L-histidine N-alpha-methyltransferase